MVTFLVAPPTLTLSLRRGEREHFKRWLFIPSPPMGDDTGGGGINHLLPLLIIGYRIYEIGY
jgi:hypothetical protein